MHSLKKKNQFLPPFTNHNIVFGTLTQNGLLYLKNKLKAEKLYSNIYELEVNRKLME